jgi:predicted phosphoadenosine phosphosulfate sulfurtransferase
MRKYLETTVYEESKKRIRYILDNFKKVYVSFSGGKDSGVMLNLMIDELRENYVGRKVGVMILDNEANYTDSLNFMHLILQKNLDILDVFWCCLPITLPCTVSSYEIDWQCWGVNDKHRWIRPMPTESYVVNIENNKFPFFRENMGYQEFWDNFGEWYSENEDCACLIGIRTHESLNRWRAIMNEDKQMHGNHMWTKKNTEHTYNCYPIYDWRTEDIWIANNINNWDYNKLYDVFWKAGLSIHQMRVASPFMSESKSSLNLYRIIDPHVWATLCARVNGANFVSTYGKQLNYNSFNLPKGHTWKTFVKFLLDTLPEKSAVNFKQRFIQSIRYWGRIGRGLSPRIISELDLNNIKYFLNGVSPHGGNNLSRVIIKSIPDHLDMLKCHNSDVISWKRYGITILKNDHTCKYLGLSPTKEQMERMKYIKNKYKKI